MKSRIFLWFSFCFLILILLSGCATIPEGSSSYSEESRSERSLSVANMLRFEDVPVPSGAKILDSESFAFQNDVTRVALLKYVSFRTADQVVWFFKQQMPLYNWRPINIIEYERRILNYEKESESCIVTIESGMRKSVITIAISPKSRPMKVEVEKE